MVEPSEPTQSAIFHDSTIGHRNIGESSKHELLNIDPGIFMTGLADEATKTEVRKKIDASPTPKAAP